MATQVVGEKPSQSMAAVAALHLAALLRMPTLVAWIAALGLLLRVFLYVLNPGVWKDELWLLRNVVSKGYLELLGPLVDDQAAPPLFLWLERTLFLLLGDDPLGLRLVSLLASCATLLVMIPVARRCLSVSAVPWALLLFAFSDKVLDHTVEAKQYLLDTFLAVLVPALYLGTRNWPSARRFLTFAILAPIVIFASFPGCFFMGGLLVALLPDVWNERRSWAAWLTYSLIVLTTFASFAALVAGPIRAQHTPELHGMWTDTFPDWARPWTVPWWTLRAFFDGVDHSFRPVGGLLTPAVIAGSIALWRRGLKRETVLLALPVVLALVAAWLHAFPYDSRVILFTTAPLALFAGEAVACFVRQARAAFAANAAPMKRIFWATLATAVIVASLAPVGLAAWLIVVPYPRMVVPWPEAADQTPPEVASQ